MNFDEFKNRVLELANDESVGLRRIQALATQFFKTNQSLSCNLTRHLL